MILNEYRPDNGPSLCMPPASDYDLLLVDVPSMFQQGPVPDGEAPSSGLLRIAAAVAQSGCSTGLLDAHRQRLGLEDIEQQIDQAAPRVVGLNPTSVNVNEAQAVAAICDRRGIPYVLGGVHATLDPSGARQDFSNALAIVRGPGEVVMGEIVKRAIDERPGSFDLPGVYAVGDDHTRLTRAPGLPLDEIPFVGQDRYIANPVRDYTASVRGIATRLYETSLYLTYGCPYSCAFCSSPVMVGRGERTGQPPYRRPSGERILDEVEYVVQNLGASALHFQDDLTFITPQHVEDFRDGVVKRGLMDKFVWRGMTRATIVNRLPNRTIGQLVETGAWKMALGIESGSNETLRRMGKGIRAEDSVAAVRRLADAGITTKGFFIFGFPGETEAQMHETATLIRTLGSIGMTEIAVFQFKPFPGTEAFQMVMQENPKALERLGYLRHTDNWHGKGKGAAMAAGTHWLPDDLQIADVPSGVVRAIVETVLDDFYQ